MTMSADLNEKRGRRRRQQDEASAAATDENEIIEAESDDDDESADASEQKGYTAPKGKPTAGRRNKQQAQEEETGLVARSVGGVQAYIEETREELLKVTWPTRPEVIRLFRIVLAVMVGASLILGAVSLVFTTLFRYGVLNPLLFVVFFAVVGGAGYLIYRRIQNIDAGNPRS